MKYSAGVTKKGEDMGNPRENMSCHAILIRFSSRMLLGDSIFNKASAASMVSILSSPPETGVSTIAKEIGVHIRPEVYFTT